MLPPNVEKHKSHVNPASPSQVVRRFFSLLSIRAVKIKLEMDQASGIAVPSVRSKGRRPILQCQFCAKTYRKREHLIRHERTHTGHRPYVCSKCDKAFARHDSLLRHDKLHTAKLNTEPSQQAKPTTWTWSQGEPLNAEAIASCPPNFQHVNISQIDTSSPTTTNDIPTWSFENDTFFTETEDFFQFLLSEPAGWPTPERWVGSTGSVHSTLNTETHQPDAGGNEGRNEGNADAVQQVGTLITDVVGYRSFSRLLLEPRHLILAIVLAPHRRD